MKILYLTYGSHSNVVNNMTHYLSINGCEVIVKNVAERFNFRYEKVKFPRISFFNVINFFFAKKQFGADWKKCYRRTDYACDKMSVYASNLVKKHRSCNVVLQSGVLFSPLLYNLNKPFYLGILDNTYLIGKLGKRRPKGIQLGDRFVELETNTYKKADKIFVMSQHVKNSLIEDYNINQDKIIVTRVGPNVVPGKSFKPPYDKYRTKKIVMIGVDFKRKGGDDLIEAFKKVRGKVPGSELVIIGEKIKINMEGVVFKGFQNAEEIKQELMGANIFVMPSYREPFGIALIEAMAFHTPCIATDIEAIPEIIENKKNGFIVKPGDIDGLADKIEVILKSPELAKKMGYEGFKMYLQYFDWDVVIKEIVKHIKH